MPMIVPEYKQQFRYESPQVPAARLQGMNVQTNAAMFGGESGRQLEKAGYLVQRGADQLSHLVDDYNTTKARDAASKMQQGFLEWQSEAQKKQGEAGMNTAADYDTWAKTKREELTKGLSDVQRGRFEMLAGTQMASQRHWASGYGQQQEQTYKKATWQAEISTAADMLATNIQNPGLAGQAMEQIKDAAFTMGQHMGIGEKATQELMRTSLQKALVPAIHARIQSGETGLASALMQQYGGSLGGTAMAQLGAELKRERKRQEAEWKAEQRATRLDAAVRETDSMFTQFGGDLASGYEYIRKKYGDDPKTRLELEAAFSRRVSMEEAAQNKTRKMQMEQHKNAALDAIGDENATPQSVSDLILKADPEIQPDLMRAVRNKFPSQEVVVSDSDKLTEAKAGILTGHYKDVKEFRRQFMPHIASNEMAKLEQDIVRNRDKASDASLRSSFNTMLREYNIEGLASTADMTPAAYSKMVWDNFVDEAFDRDFQTAQEKRQYMQDYLRRVSLTKPGKIFGDVWPSKEEVPEYAARPLRAEGYTEAEPERPQGLPNAAKWDAAKVGWVYQGKIVYAAKVVQQ